MRNRNMIRLTMALPVVLSGLVFAADPPEGVPGNAPAQEQVKAENLATTTLRAGKLIGTSVLTKDDKTVGDIKDIVLSNDLKKAGYVVVSCNDIGGMTGKLAAVPLQAIHFDIADKGSARLGIGEMALRTSPTFAQKDWPEASAADTYYSKANDYYAQQLKTSQAEPAGAKLGETNGIWTRRASELIGRDIQNSRGEGLGELKDIVIDWNTGDVRYGVLAFGGVMGIGDKLFAVPIDQFQTQPGEKYLVLKVDKEQLKAAPGFDKDHWPDFSNPDWRKSVDTFYAKPGTAAPAQP